MIVDHSYTRSSGQKLIIAMLYRAFRDAIGQTCPCADDSRKQRRQAIASGRAFINEETEVFWGSEWKDASELCEIATGSDFFLTQLQRAIILYDKGELPNDTALWKALNYRANRS